MSKPMRIPDLRRLEEDYDRGKTGVVALLESLARRDWAAFYPIAESSFAEARSAAERAFVLQWAIAATEIEYDLPKRASWLKRWAEVPDWAADQYCLYHWTFQQGLSAFFEGSLREAEARFRRALDLAIESNYPRGRMRALFHLGLTCRDLGNLSRAAEFFEESLALARARKANKLIDRIQAQLGKPEQRSSAYRFDHAKARIEALLLARDFARARALLAEADSRRRQAGLRRRRESLFSYLPLVALGQGRPRIAARVLARISDPILRIRILNLKKALFGLEDVELRELSLLRSLHGISDIITQSAADAESAEICGIPLRSVTDAEVKSLLKLLLAAAEAVPKERICEAVWGLAYDPVVHDGKIYKLIHRARGVFNRSDLFVNCYGSYRMNPELLPANAPLARTQAS
ncbi:MAG: tetratricopeptide repeat protein [Oligoflexia bacterium]|nr:tetratricopeptide repeat protein [Oligoflexia bacterium]